MCRCSWCSRNVSETNGAKRLWHRSWECCNSETIRKCAYPRVHKHTKRNQILTYPEHQHKKWVFFFFFAFGRVLFWRIGHQHPDEPSIITALDAVSEASTCYGKSTNQGAETETEVGDGGGWLDGSIPETKGPSTWHSEVGSDELVSVLGTVGRCESFFFESDLIFWIRLLHMKKLSEVL